MVPGSITSRKFKRRICDTLFLMATAGKMPPEMRIVQKRQTIHWDLVWRNLPASCVPEEFRSAWYAVIHDILPTRERLAAINLIDIDSCQQCGATCTIAHRLTECGDEPAIWNWTRQRIAMMLRMDPKYVPASWTLNHDFRLWTPGRRRAVLWTLAPYGLVPNIQTTTPIHSRILRLYATIEVESVHQIQTTGSSWQLLLLPVRRQLRST